MAQVRLLLHVCLNQAKSSEQYRTLICFDTPESLNINLTNLRPGLGWSET